MEFTPLPRSPTPPPGSTQLPDPSMTATETAATMMPGMLRSDQQSEKLLTLAKSSAWGWSAKFRFGAEATYTAASDIELT